MSDNEGSAASAAMPDVTAIMAEGTAGGHWALDPAGSQVQFHVKHFWGAITVHGSFGQVTGEGEVGPDGSVDGQTVLDAASLSTQNKQRDKHLRSADFFDSDNHQQVVVSVLQARPAGPAGLAYE